jgi:N-acetylglucosaminyldiphosphoundecaprenol N-acetyl-beta-D-mannosaminyltransferase
MQKENYLGVNVCCENEEMIFDNIDSIIKNKKPSFIVAINPEKIMKAACDENLMKLLNSAAIQIPDGIGIVIASRIKGGKIKKRITGIDLMEKIIRRASQKSYRVFLLGAKPGTADEAAKILSHKYPGLRIAGVMDGYFKDDNEAVSKITDAKPDILFVAMGSPKQEYWITKNMEKLKVPLCMGIGGSLDVISGNVKRAPEFMRKSGLEWLYRLFKEPWRYKRMAVLPLFLLKVIFKNKR